MKSIIFFSFALFLLITVSEMDYNDEVKQGEFNCKHWPLAFDYCDNGELVNEFEENKQTDFVH